MRKRLIVGIIIGLIAIALIFRIIQLLTRTPGGSPPRGQRPPVAVEIDSVRYGTISELRQFVGTVQPLYRYLVAPKVAGRVVEIRKRIGDPVRANEVVARIDDAEYQQALREAEASLKIAQASLTEAQSQFALARQELERVQQLKEKGIASPAELDAATTNYEAQQSRLKLAQAQVEQREAALRSAQIRLNYTVLTAPAPGFTGERFVDEGALLAANAPVISVVGIEKVIVRTTVSERDYGRLEPGQPASVMVDAYPERRFSGTLARIAPLLREESRMAEVEVEVANDSLILKPGMFARVTVVLASSDQAQLVPSRAVVTRDGQKAVFVVDSTGSTVHLVPITTGIVTPELTQVLSPRLNGPVVTLGQHLLADGNPVLLPGARPRGRPGAGGRTR
ncbi:MAG: efflux RND transporter periplasmic adaptor subunit [candidate division KSB1 bacterium]|nr:efflux RND transporter periplasmic adaptor subunit [candidate division KSB1 bacterium]MDZ7294951.1 efflux RND transporter periplasmic adaptor subunit [candidate division KSB1 bacterium]MDZ7386104.1 efflux RND transporter periplasmic adaptor subunit [candidate division KSB1 bacterium]MDZ7393002.1 efflux RND transporter periplasmic adaptor subunit [candidate division KSB1 bacterium]MDZ7413541.1 efflux RND transporter periplasmic adaptor subunit [candidate division KSB1 bacterium]